MTLATSSSTVSYQGNGSTVQFPFAFPVLSPSHLVVVQTDTTQSPNVPTALTAAQYSVSGIGTATGGTVTLPAPLAAGMVLTINRVVPYTQNTSIVNQGGFYPDVLENALDYLTMEVQQLAEQASRTVLVPVGSGTDPSSYLTNVQSAAATAVAQANVTVAAASTTLAALSVAQAAALTASAAATTCVTAQTTASAAASTCAAALSGSQAAALTASAAASTCVTAMGSAQAAAITATAAAAALTTAQAAAQSAAATATTCASQAQTWALQAQSAITGAVKVDGNDTTAGFLTQKLVAGSNVTLTVGNVGGNETVSIAAASPYDVTGHINDGLLAARSLGLTSTATRIYNGMVDAFNDQTAQDLVNSVGQMYDNTNKWYSNADMYTTFLPRAAAGNTGADQSALALAMVAANVTTTASSKQDAYAWVFNGSNSAINVTTAGGATQFNGDFTVEFWYNAAALPVSNTQWTLFDTSTTNSTATSINVLLNACNGNWWSINCAGTSLNVTNTVAAGIWTHMACVRSGAVITLYINGAAVGTLNNSTNLSEGKLTLGKFGSGASQYYNGALAGFRISKIARYTSGFTPPAQPFTIGTIDGVVDPNTSLLLHYDGNLTDSSGFGQTLTAANLTYGAAKFGTASASFNGASSKVTGTAPSWTGDLDFETWINPSNFSAARPVMDTRASVTSTGGILLSINTSGLPVVTINNTAAITGNTAITAGIWTHIRLSRANGLFLLFLNGVVVGSYGFGNTLSDGKLLLGNDVGGTTWFAGLMDETRISTCARAVQTFTPPTAAYTLGTGFALQNLPVSAVNGTPATGRIVLRHQDVNGTVVVGTDLLVDMSSNGGVTWNSVTNLVKADPWDAATSMIVGSAALTGGGTTMLCRIRTANNKPQRIRAAAFYWN